MDIQALKKQAAAEVDRVTDDLIAVASYLHAHPEIGLHEYQACQMLCIHLRQAGYEILERPAGLSTAFKAYYGKAGAPVVAFLAEYDALPGLGHACGHNLMAAMSLGAALAVRPVLDQVDGMAIVVGTPDEEDTGGKIPLVRAGVFDGLSAAMLVHPGTRNLVKMEALAALGFLVRFRGRAAHAAAEPHKGINALDGLIQAYNGINALRQHLRDDVRIHGIITHGGDAPNIVPDLAEGRFIIRARDRAYLEEVRTKVLRCLEGAALASGASLETEWQEVFDDMRNNMPLARAFGANLESLGFPISENVPGEGLGSTDMGNVSYVAPSIHPLVAIAEPGVPGHTPQFARAAASPTGFNAMVAGAKAMAMTAIDIWLDQTLREQVQRAFRPE